MVLNPHHLARHKICTCRDSLVAPCRSAHLGGNLLRAVSRTPDTPGTREGRDDEYGKLHASGLHSTGRILLNLWRLIRGEVWDACVRMGFAAARTLYALLRCQTGRIVCKLCILYWAISHIARSMRD
jgi:hypothetical protein